MFKSYHLDEIDFLIGGPCGEIGKHNGFKIRRSFQGTVGSIPTKGKKEVSYILWISNAIYN